MKRKKSKENISNKKFQLLLAGVIFALTLFLGIGYAQVSDINLAIDGLAMTPRQTGIVITDVHYSSNNNAIPVESKIKSYYQTIMDSKMTLGNALDSSITYEMTITNTTDDDVAFDKVIYGSEFYDNEDIVFELVNLQQDDILAAHSSITFQITN